MVDLLSVRLVPDELWAIVEPLVPSFAPRSQGGGTAPADSRAVFTAIVYVLTSGCTWRQLLGSFAVDYCTAHRSSGSAGMVLATRNGQMVMVTVDSVPVQIAGEWGILGAGAVSTMASTGGGEGDGSRPPGELTDDEKWEQTEQARQRQAAERDPGPSSAVAEVYSTPEAAIGQVEGRVTVIDKVETENAGLRAQGFTKTWYVEGADGRQWTVHYNPRTGQFTGDHLSSSNF